MIRNFDGILDNFDLKIIVQKRGATISVAIIPSIKAGKSAAKLEPISISGDIDFVEEKLANFGQEIVNTHAQRLYNIAAFNKSLEKAEEAGQAKAKESTTSKDKPASKKVIDKPVPVALPLLSNITSLEKPVEIPEPNVSVAPVKISQPTFAVQNFASVEVAEIEETRNEFDDLLDL